MDVYIYVSLDLRAAKLVVDEIYFRNSILTVELPSNTGMGLKF